MSLLSKFKIAVKNLVQPKVITNINVITFPESKLLKGRNALITGGTSGIGYSIAEAFIKAGACVTITGRKKERIDQAVNKLQKKYPQADLFGIVMDNAKVECFDSTFQKLISDVKAKGCSPIDILVNNAGVNFKGMPNATEYEYDKVLDTNLKGVFFLSQMFGKYLIGNKIKGNILNIASSSSLRPADSAYTVSKWGIRGLTLGLAKSLAKYGITVNGLAPGPTATPMMMAEGQKDMTLQKIPLGRYIMPEEIANMATILVSSMGRAIMGDIVYMTGGAGLLTYDDVPYNF